MIQLTLTINQFVKTVEGQQLIESGRVFCLGGQLYQGYQGTPATVYEKQLTHAEMMAAQDIDNTKQAVWVMRRQRVGARHDRKANEYRKRRADMRAEQGMIEERIERRQRMGLPASAADMHDLKELDQRMQRLIELAGDEEVAAGGVKAEPDETPWPGEPVPDQEPDPEEAHTLSPVEEAKLLAELAGEKPPDILARAKAALSSCAECGVACPEGKDPAKWLRGHMMGKHKKGVRKAS